MLMYTIKRLLYTIPILLGVNALTFCLFFMVNSPDDMARVHLGEKHVTQAAIADWKKEKGYDKPLFENGREVGLKRVTETIFFEKSLNLFSFEFGQSDAGRDIGYDIWGRMGPSLLIAVPSLIIGVVVNIVCALFITFFRRTYLDPIGVYACIFLMSISMLFYIVGGQFIVAKSLNMVPISGYERGWSLLRFLMLPVAINVIAGIGSGVRWYRALFLEEINKDYVRTARAKGVSELRVLFKHVLPNALIPIMTGVVVLLPLLFMGSLLTESFFGIPGLGSYTVDAIAQQDFAIVRAMVFLGSVLYMLGLLLTDFVYAWVDPRVRFD